MKCVFKKDQLDDIWQVPIDILSIGFVAGMSWTRRIPSRAHIGSVGYLFKPEPSQISAHKDLFPLSLKVFVPVC